MLYCAEIIHWDGYWQLPIMVCCVNNYLCVILGLWWCIAGWSGGWWYTTQHLCLGQLHLPNALGLVCLPPPIRTTNNLWIANSYRTMNEKQSVPINPATMNHPCQQRHCNQKASIETASKELNNRLALRHHSSPMTLWQHDCFHFEIYYERNSKARFKATRGFHIKQHRIFDHHFRITSVVVCRII